MGPDDVLSTYERAAPRWDAARGGSLFERGWLDRMLAAAPGRRVLDLGCGSGRPIAAYLAGCGAAVCGVDGAAAMVALFRRNLPGAAAICADMRSLTLGVRFDAILAWDSLFHLAPYDQRAMFGVFAAHAAPGAALMFTAGDRAGEPVGRVAGTPVYHASLAPEVYGRLLVRAGFVPLATRLRDPDCGGHSVWLARARVTA